MPSEPGDSWFSPKGIEVPPRRGPTGGSALDRQGGEQLTDPNQTVNAGGELPGVRRRVRRFVVERGTAQTAG